MSRTEDAPNTGAHEPSADWINAARQKIMAELEAASIDPNGVLFAGYHPEGQKLPGSEFERPDGRYEYYLGTAKSLAPASPDDNEEIAGERWMANPLRYAQEPGSVVGVFAQASLGPYVEEFDEDFGTYLVVATPEQIATAQVQAISLSE